MYIKKQKAVEYWCGVQSTGVVLQNTGSSTIPKMVVCKTRNGRGQIGD